MDRQTNPSHVKAGVMIIVAKQPLPGHTKTRLSPPLSPLQAAQLYECFLQDTIALVRSLSGVHPAIAYLPETARAYFAELAPGFDLIPQQGAGLGERLDHALHHYLQAGHPQAVIMDSDSPTLPLACLSGAFTALSDGAEVVLGPTEDGGYYLIGLKRIAHRLLREVQMSTPTVTADTLALASEEGIAAALLPAWYDIDTVEDLRQLRQELSRLSPEIAPATRQFLAANPGILSSQPTNPVPNQETR